MIAKCLGASNLLLKPTADYIKYYIMFGIFFCGSMTLSTFVRNDNNPRLAFWGMITGAVSNIFLDWLFIFIFKMGITGAAIASGLGQLLACIILSTHFIAKKGLKLNVLLAFIIYAILILFGKSIISIFNTNPQLIKIAYKCISIYGISFLFASINIVITTYYLSTKQTTEALIIATLRSFVTNIFFIFLMPLLFGINAIWTGMIVAEVTVLLIALSINNTKHKKGIV